MVITYHGGHFVKISHGDTVIAANPFGKQAKYKPLRFGARIGLVSMNHPEMNGTDNLSYGEKVPFVISGPGEYEIGGVSISGFLFPKPTGKEGLLNTIYTIELEKKRLCFLRRNFPRNFLRASARWIFFLCRSQAVTCSHLPMLESSPCRSMRSWSFPWCLKVRAT